MKGWGAVIAVGFVVLAGCETARTPTDVRDQGAVFELTSARPVDDALRCLAGRVETAWSEVYPDPVHVEVEDPGKGDGVASLSVFKIRRAKSVLHWEDDPLWVFDLQATANNTAVHVFEDRNNPFYADTREGRIKSAFRPCISG